MRTSRRHYKVKVFTFKPRDSQCARCRKDYEACRMSVDLGQMPILETKGSTKFIGCLAFEKR